MAANPVIAHSVTRAPLVPIQYEQAVKSLQACITLDEAKYWSDKADALAAWARIYRSNQVAVEAQRLKLHAYRRMGELAQQLRPHQRKTDCANGTSPGPVSLLREQGFNQNAATQMRTIARLPEKKFDDIVNSKAPPSPTRLITVQLRRNPGWSAVQSILASTRSLLRKNKATALATSLLPKDVEKAREMVGEIREWCDEFESSLPIN